MRYLAIIFLTLLSSLPAYADDSGKKQVSFSEEKKERVRKKFPPIKTGFLVDLDPHNRDGFFYFGLEVKAAHLLNQRFSLDFGVATGRVLAGLGIGLWFEKAVGPFIWTGYNISGNALAMGIGLNMLKL